MKVTPSAGFSFVTKFLSDVPAIFRDIIEPITPASASFNKLIFLFRLVVLRFALRLAMFRAMVAHHYEAYVPDWARLQQRPAGF